ERGEYCAANCPVECELVRMCKARAPHGVVREYRHAEECQPLQRAEDAADRQPVCWTTHPVVVVCGADDARNEHETYNHVQPLLHHLPVHSRETNEQVGKQACLYHFPHSFNPQVDRPPAIEDAYSVVVEYQERRKVEERRQPEPCHENSFGRGPAPCLADGHQDVVQEHQHHDHDQQLVRPRLLQQLVPCSDTEQEADDDDYAVKRPEPQLPVGELLAVDLCSGFFGNHVIGGAHEAGEHPHDEQVRVYGLHLVERQQVDQGIRAQILHGAQDSEYHLQAEQQHRDHEVGVRDPLCAVTHDLVLLSQ